MSRVKVWYVNPGGQGFHRHGGLAEKGTSTEGRSLGSDAFTSQHNNQRLRSVSEVNSVY